MVLRVSLFVRLVLQGRRRWSGVEGGGNLSVTWGFTFGFEWKFSWVGVPAYADLCRDPEDVTWINVDLVTTPRAHDERVRGLGKGSRAG